jgi:methanogenic corrinoid protein MtbC1
LSDIEAKLAKYKDKIIYSNIIETDLEFVNSTVYVGYAHGDIFLDQLKLAAHNKVPIKNCFLCKYSEDNWDYANNQLILDSIVDNKSL